MKRDITLSINFRTITNTAIIFPPDYRLSPHTMKDESYADIHLIGDQPTSAWEDEDLGDFLR